MRMIAVTGTNGKTTVTYLTAQLLEQAGDKAGLIGTLGAGRLNQLELTGYTTPDAKMNAILLPKLIEQGCETIVMEVSSHGLKQNRVKDIPFEIAAFTNLSHDHLDYHGSMEEYVETKAKLFEWPSLKTAVINVEDPYAEQILQHCQAENIIRIEPSKAHFKHLKDGFELEGQNLALLGEFNIQNTLIARAIAQSMYPDFEFDLSQLKAADGRMELWPLPSGATAVIDYAHTPDALEKALQACRSHCHGKLWVVFGCGGDRDRTKRPLMAKAAEQLADHIIITEDNARHENPDQIFADVAAGLSKNYQLIRSRGEAIKTACQNAETGDIVLLAGKGHERYMDVKGERVGFDERDFLPE